MTLSSPSSLAAATSASIPPRSSAEVAVAALLLSPLPPEPLSEPQAASARAVDNAATALKVVRNRTDVLQVEARSCGPPLGRRHTGVRIVAAAEPFALPNSTNVW